MNLRLTAWETFSLEIAVLLTRSLINGNGLFKKEFKDTEMMFV